MKRQSTTYLEETIASLRLIDKESCPPDCESSASLPAEESCPVNREAVLPQTQGYQSEEALWAFRAARHYRRVQLAYSVARCLHRHCQAYSGDRSLARTDSETITHSLLACSVQLCPLPSTTRNNKGRYKRNCKPRVAKVSLLALSLEAGRAYSFHLAPAFIRDKGSQRR